MVRAGNLLGHWWAGVCFNLYLRKAYQDGRSPADYAGLANSYPKVVRAVCKGLGIAVKPEDEGGIGHLDNDEWRRVARQMATAIDPRSTVNAAHPEGWRAMWERANGR